MCILTTTNNDGKIDENVEQISMTTTMSPSSTKQQSETQRWMEELQEQFKTFLPTVCGMVLYRVPGLISLRFVGEIGEQQLAAAALATTLCNVTGLSLSVGLSSAMTTLTAQARGDLMERMKRGLMVGGGDDVESSIEESPLLASNKPMECSQRKYVTYQSTTSTDNMTTSSSEILQDDNDNNHTTNTTTSTTDDDKILLPMVTLYRGIFIQLLVVIPMGLWWIHGIGPFLLALGQTPLIAQMTAQYLAILAPGLWAYSINWTFTAWLQAIEMADVPAYAAALGLVFHIPFNYLFIYWLGFGYLGCAIATVLMQTIQPILIITYLFGTKSGRARVLHNIAAPAMGRTCLSTGMTTELQRAVSSIAGIMEYFGLAIPGVVAISEWWASELAIFLSGRLDPRPEVAIGGMTLYQSINSSCFMVPVAASVAGSSRVGNLLGAGKTHAAALAAKVSVVSAALISGTMGCILFLTPHEFFPSLFAPGNDVVAETSKLIPLLSTYVFADGVQCAFNGIIKGCGRQCVVMPIVGFAYWIVAIPLAYYLAFIRYGGQMCNAIFCGDRGLVVGMTTGTWVHMLLLAAVVILTTNWKREAFRAQERLSKISR